MTVRTRLGRRSRSHESSLVVCRGNKPDPPERGQVADLPLYAALFKDECSLYMDMSGDSLHKRGYKSAMHVSSLNESAAAGILSLADWGKASAAAGVMSVCAYLQHIACMLMPLIL